MRIPKAAIPKFAGVKTDLLTDADNSDLRKAIADAVPTAVEQTKELAPYFRATNERESCKRIFDFLKQRVKYKADDYRQVVQMPSAILRPGAIADCKSLSLFTAAILQNLGIPWHFVLTSYTDSAIPGHIYVQTDSGCIIDVVWGKFDSEKKANHRYKMKVSYLAGITGPMFASDKSSKGYCGIGATEGAIEWAKRNGVWDKYTTLQKAKIRAAQAFGIAIIARALLRGIIQGNAGGIATMMREMRLKAASDKTAWDSVRKIELTWLENGGNPNELYEIIDKGASKPAKGKKFGKLLQDLKNGKKANIKDWTAAIISALFGKKYDAQTGRISGYGIGQTDPVTTTGEITSSAAIWQPIIEKIIAAITSGVIASVLAKIQPAADETTTDTTGGGVAPSPGGEPSGNLTPTGSKFPTTYIIIGAAALGALWYFNKKKK